MSDDRFVKHYDLSATRKPDNHNHVPGGVAPTAPHRRKRGRPKGGRRSTEGYTQLNVYIPEALRDQVKLKLLMENGKYGELSALVEHLLTIYLCGAVDYTPTSGPRR